MSTMLAYVTLSGISICRDELPEGVDFELEVDAPGPLPEGGEKENSKEEKPVDPDDEGVPVA